MDYLVMDALDLCERYINTELEADFLLNSEAFSEIVRKPRKLGTRRGTIAYYDAVFDCQGSYYNLVLIGRNYH